MKRYTPDCSVHMSHEIAFMREIPNGGYVEYQDLAAVKAQRDNLAIRVTELEKKLATPLQLPDERFLYHESDYDDGYVHGWNAVRRESIELLKKLGFTIDEGE